MFEWLHKVINLKPGFGKRDMYLGKKLCKTRLHNEVWALAMSPVKCIREAVTKCTLHISSNYRGKYRMPKKAENPFKMGYDPELDTSQEIDPSAVSYHLTIIGILRWMIELGRMEIITKESLLASIPCSIFQRGTSGGNSACYC